MRVWIDRTNDGLSGMPADSINRPPKKGGTSARPAGPAGKSGYINPRLGGRGYDRFWHFCDQGRPMIGVDRK
jgi:hypothetical protein